MLIIFTESVLLYHFKGFILEIKTRQYKKKEVRVVLLHIHEVTLRYIGHMQETSFAVARGTHTSSMVPTDIHFL